MTFMYNHLCCQYCTQQTSLKWACLHVKFSKCSKKQMRSIKYLLNLDICFYLQLKLLILFQYLCFFCIVFCCQYIFSYKTLCMHTCSCVTLCLNDFKHLRAYKQPVSNRKNAINRVERREITIKTSASSAITNLQTQTIHVRNAELFEIVFLHDFECFFSLLNTLFLF